MESDTRPLFSRPALVRLIVPLVIEQFLLMTVGMADTVMVTSTGQAAVSGVSLVDNINLLLIQIFAALSTGGAVVVSQYLGREKLEDARTAARQLLYTTTAVSTALMVLALVFRQHVLALLFGNIEPDVMDSAATAPQTMKSPASSGSETRKPSLSCSAPKTMRPSPFMTLTRPTHTAASSGDAPPSVNM